MSKNGWIACIIGVIVFLCACVLLFIVSLVGVTSIIYIAPTIGISFPLRTSVIDSPTPSPVVIRPTSKATATTASPLLSSTPQVGLASPGPITPPILVPTDTLTTLSNTIIPINDPIDLAHRLLKLDIIAPTATPPASIYQIGTQQSFWVGNGEDENFKVEATLQYVTDHAYFWIQDYVPFRQRDLSDLANIFENKIYTTDRSFFGSEWTPGVDGDPHIYILYARGIGDGIAGYFSSADEAPQAVNRYSNGHEMFLINADNSPLDDEYTFGVLAHELQHMIHWYQDRNESNWISEGFSELAVMLNDFYSGGFDALYTSDPDLQLNDWPDDIQNDTTPHYGASFLFVNYFLDRFGEAATKALVANQDNGFKGIDSTLKQFDAVDPLTGKLITADDFFLDWGITNYLMDPRVSDGRYAYKTDLGTPNANATETIHDCPVDNVTRNVHQFGFDYIRINCPGSYTLHFEGSIYTPLLPQDPHSGRYAFWANKGDESDTSLTQTFDLTSSSGPLSLSYWTWYELENGWDYVYLEASTDGENWQVLTTPSGTSYNPQGNSYGWGYTNYSGAGFTPGWVQETVDLSQFAGQKLTLRFEYVTDGNVTGEGFLLDDISIPAIGYSADFEKDDGGWLAAGWARIENVLPQKYGLALISVGRTTSVQHITLNPDITADIPFTIGDGVDNVALVVSGTTRFTRQLAPYRFSVISP